MIWVLAVGLIWLIVALVAGVIIGRSIRLADRRAEEQWAASAVDAAPREEPAGRRRATGRCVRPSERAPRRCAVPTGDSRSGPRPPGAVHPGG